jgi:hypothetical protein
MRIPLAILLLGAALVSQAQSADDYYPDARKKNENFVKLRDKDMRAHIATFALAGIDERLGKEPLRTQVPAVAYGSDYISFEGNNIKVIIRSKPFEPDKHKLTYYNEKFLVKIDNKPYYGNYTQVPTTSIASVRVVVGGDTVEIPPAAYEDLHSPVFAYRDAGGTIRTHNRVYLSPDGRNIYIYMLNDEVKGKYEVTWIIQDKKYLQRVVDTGLMQ